MVFGLSQRTVRAVVTLLFMGFVDKEKYRRMPDLSFETWNIWSKWRRIEHEKKYYGGPQWNCVLIL